MSLVSWAKKELARFKVEKSKRFLLPKSNLASSNSKSLPLPSASQTIIAADLRCLECQRRVSGILTQIDDVESMVFHVFEKKVTLNSKATA